MNKYYNWTSGRLNGGSVWTDANALETVHMLMLQNERTDWDGVADNSYLGRHALNTLSDWQAFTGGYIDDAGWCVLDLWAMADYKTFRGENHVEDAGQLYDKMAENWDDTCGGGVWWTTDHGYKNAITNELFLTISAQGYLRFGNKTYLENAKKTWAWLEASGMRNSDGLYNDGLDDTCINNGQTTWTYNQGVVASGLGALWKATGNRTLLEEAEITLGATIKDMTVNGVLKESCDSVIETDDPCDIDQGIWTKHLQYYLIFTNEKEKIAKYGSFLGAQSHAVIKYATNATDDISNLWYAPDSEGGAIYNIKSLPSGIMAHVAAAQFGDCERVDSMF
ncbi:glycoside hydrolase family 76 protein [Desarmillaria tabescens]|uniref:Glycoside hydrolase family 76 protein n=1 Tax=Armillaria tabescens TaxID=1929756 RepID=A0AA39K6I6_ARMTA|nr:glycoside hydrolase family 76 protein [Desarmillaria tabescens]KAK0455481.1 glycoside hydrolase family 76 protein [Desarmillaria tabescens]